MCLYPKLIENKKYLANEKNKGIIPEMKDERVKFVSVGCGKCIECSKKKANSWRVRLLEEIKVNKAIFVTMTFSNEELFKLENDIIKSNSTYIDVNNIATLAVRRFLERYRKRYKKSVRHWLITELGHENTERIHIHGLIFKIIDKVELEELWKYGNVWIGEFVNEKTVNYIIKYLSKYDQKHKDYKPKILCSAGLGKNYLNSYNAKRNQFNGKFTRDYYVTKQGYKIQLPTYYRNHIYSEDEKEQLWLNILDEETRYVCGEKIDVSETEDEYEKLRDYYRIRNAELNYGDDRINWDEKNYKNKLKKLKYLHNKKNKQ